MIASTTVEDTLQEIKQTPKRSSPGFDGLPYEILYLVMKFPRYQEMLSVVYNEPLQKSKFPNWWDESVICLLYKKGDPADMKNYRPFSLANTDHELFIRTINRQILEVSSHLISRHQLGFIPGRFITENGIVCQLIMENAQ